jgi:hypothetical protein
LPSCCSMRSSWSAIPPRFRRVPARTAMLFLMHLTDRQSRLLRDHLDEDMTWSPGQVQCVESFPDLDTLARIFDGRRLRLELAVALRCALFSCSQYFVTVIGSASRRRGHKLIRESRGIHRVFLAAGDEHYIARVPRLLGFRFSLDLAPGDARTRLPSTADGNRRRHGGAGTGSSYSGNAHRSSSPACEARYAAAVSDDAFLVDPEPRGCWPGRLRSSCYVSRLA